MEVNPGFNSSIACRGHRKTKTNPNVYRTQQATKQQYIDERARIAYTKLNSKSTGDTWTKTITPEDEARYAKMEAESAKKEAAEKLQRFKGKLKFLGVAAMFALGILGVNEIKYQSAKHTLKEFNYTTLEGKEGNSMEDLYRLMNPKSKDMSDREITKNTAKFVKELNKETKKANEAKEVKTSENNTYQMPTDKNGNIDLSRLPFEKGNFKPTNS